MKRVLVPLDGTKDAEAALAKLEDICEPGAEVILLTVRHPDTAPRSGFTPGVIISTGGLAGASPDLPTFVETRDQVFQEESAQSKDYLESLAAPLRERGFRVQTEVLLNDKADAAIIEYAKAKQPTFIAMLRRTHPRLSELLFGSVASGIVRANVAPVLFVPDNEAAKPG